VNDTAAAIYLLHTVGASGATNIFASVSIQYADGTMKTQYLQKEKSSPIGGSFFNHRKDRCMWAGPNLKAQRLVFIASQ
jgi:hypothetical protein